VAEIKAIYIVIFSSKVYNIAVRSYKKEDFMGPYYYVVEKISGDYAFLKRTDIEDTDLLQVAMALLPSEIDEGTKLKWENLVYTIE
jgi:hypothetical protein